MIILLFLRNLVHQFIDLIQQVQPLACVLCLGDPGVNAAGDLIDVISDVMDLRPQIFDFLGGAGPNRSFFQKAYNESSFRKSALLGLCGEQLILCWSQFQVKMMCIAFVGHALCSLVPR